MLKVLKEIFIYILLIALIVLIFGILFYEQLPSNKIVPGKVEYTLPEKLEEELDKTLEEVEENEEILVTYTIEEEDLDKYEKSDDYNPGKVNPFAEYSEADNDSEDNDDSKDNNSSNSGSSGSGQLTETKPGK